MNQKKGVRGIFFKYTVGLFVTGSLATFLVLTIQNYDLNNDLGRVQGEVSVLEKEVSNQTNET